MSNDNAQHLNTIKTIHEKRLAILERQAATYGRTAVPPHIEIEIEELKAKIEEIDAQLGGGQSSAQEPSRKPINGQGSKVKILFLTANPSDTTQLRLGEEIRAIDDALRKADFREQFDLIQHHAVRVSDLSGLLLRHKPDIVHFSGHGSQDNEIILEDNNGNSFTVSQRALSGLFKTLRDNICCVVLNACYSQPQAEAIAEHIDCVIGMSDTILDTASISFATAFYQGLGYGRTIREAFDLGQTQIDLEHDDLIESEKPQLIVKQGSNPDTLYLVREN